MLSVILRVSLAYFQILERLKVICDDVIMCTGEFSGNRVILKMSKSFFGPFCFGYNF